MPATKFTDLTQYDEQQRHNSQAFMEMLKAVRPDVFVVADVMDQTGCNPVVLMKFMWQMHRLATGSAYGNVEAIMEEGIIRTIRSLDTARINEPALVQTRKVE